ncbi:unnamed protein product [Eruca vesicaria subsp. sativa]|uniref:Uncharacterized protein n=1 Tax=Eruca vesicaria subsp. sativa TaxID=29727 RepID=A0ABC8JGT9_ERUVS|nr:unnamed protein product [Eruca vesicaria subsp. sativa]
MEILVNSYHHQGAKRLAQRFVPMAFASDGLMEGFNDPDAYNPEEGKFVMGLQFHPERMRSDDLDEFDYPGCPAAYQEFSKAVIAYQKKLNSTMSVPKTLELNREMENKRKILVRSFLLARNMYAKGAPGPRKNPSKGSELEVGDEFLESNTALSAEQETRLKEMEATVRNGGSYIKKMKVDQEKQRMARNMMNKMNTEQLSELMTFYHLMGNKCCEVLESKVHGNVNECFKDL